MKLGDRVRSTCAWKQSHRFCTGPFCRITPRYGTVVGYSRTANCVTITWDGNSRHTKDVIHTKFLELSLPIPVHDTDR